MYLVDTNVLIIAAKSEEPDKSFLNKIISQKQLILSVVSVGEFLSQSSEEEEKKFNSLIQNMPILEVNLEVARLAGEYRKKFLKKKRVQLLDYFLAAQAKLNNLILVTHNKSDFPMKDIKVITP